MPAGHLLTASRRRRRGFAMPLMLIVLLVLTVVTVTLVGTGSRDIASTRATAARTEGRLLASSVLEDFYARIRANPQGVFKVLAATTVEGLSGTGFENYQALRLTPSTTPWSTLPTPTLSSPAPAAFDNPYGRTIGSEPCPADFSRDCFYVAVVDKTGSGSRPGAFTVRVNLRLRCDGVEVRCVFVSFEQRLRRTQFYDFALAQKFSTLAPEALFEPGSWANGEENKSSYEDYADRCSGFAPARAAATGLTSVALGSTNYRRGDPNAGVFTHSPGDTIDDLPACIDISYQKDDQLGSAPVYSGDEYLTVCGTPAFGQVFLTGKGSNPSADPNSWFTPSGACSSSTNPSVSRGFSLNFPAMVLPTKETLSSAAAAAGLTPIGPAEMPALGPYVVDLSQVPSPGVILTGDGNPGTLDAIVFGEVAGRKSVVVVDGSIAVVNDVKYANGTNGGDAFSLTASERIEIWQSCGDSGEPANWPGEPGVTGAGDFATLWDPSSRCVPEEADTGPAFSRTLHGVLTSPDGFVGVPDWLTNVDTQRTQGELDFFGSMASRYQGVFGSFAGDGVLVSGFKKKFSHDDRLTRFVNGASVPTNFALPPFVVESEVPVWTRLDLTEVPYQG